MNRGAWRAAVHEVTKSRARLKQLSIRMRARFPIILFFSCNKNFKDLSSQQLSHMQYRCINHSQHAVHYTPRTYFIREGLEHH